jgi:hypothetical protein
MRVLGTAHNFGWNEIIKEFCLLEYNALYSPE